MNASGRVPGPLPLRSRAVFNAGFQYLESRVLHADKLHPDVELVLGQALGMNDCGPGIEAGGGLSGRLQFEVNFYYDIHDPSRGPLILREHAVKRMDAYLPMLPMG